MDSSLLTDYMVDDFEEECLWKPEVSLEEGIKRVYEWYKEQL